MTTLTYESLDDAIRNISNFVESPEDMIALRPTKLIVFGDIKPLVTKIFKEKTWMRYQAVVDTDV